VSDCPTEKGFEFYKQASQSKFVVEKNIKTPLNKGIEQR
jgi:hypothetical protein